MYDMLQLVVKAAKIQRAKSRVEFRAIIPTSLSMSNIARSLLAVSTLIVRRSDVQPSDSDLERPLFQPAPAFQQHQRGLFRTASRQILVSSREYRPGGPVRLLIYERRLPYLHRQAPQPVSDRPVAQVSLLLAGSKPVPESLRSRRRQDSAEHKKPADLIGLQF